MVITNTTVQAEFAAKALELGYALTFTAEGEFNYLIPVDRNNHTPEIFGGRDSYWNKGEREPFTIQTTAYGPMSPEDIDKVMQGYMRAKLMVSYMQAWGF